MRIQDAALVAAATLAQRYITDRFLPDKAIDLVDEACAVIRTEIDSHAAGARRDHPPRHAARDRGGCVKKEKDKASKERLEALRRELADLRAQADAMTAQWEAERNAIHKLQTLREELEQVRREIEQAERNYDLNRAAELRHGRLPELERRLRAEEERLGEKQGGTRLLREEVTEEEIAEIVARWTGIPVARLLEGEREKLLRLDEVLHERVIGQDEAVRLVADAVHPCARGDQGSAPSDRLVHLPRADRGGQDRALASPRRGAVRLRGEHRCASTCPSTRSVTPSVA